MNLHESVDHILAEGTTLTDRFYELFFERHPEARALFDKTHMAAQSVMLSAALMVTKHYPDYPLATRQYLNVLGTRHALGFFQSVDGADVGMVQQGQDFSLSPEAGEGRR